MRAFLLLLCVVGSVSAAAQPLLHSRQGSASAYVYQISNAQAEKVCRAKIWQADSTFFHTLRDSFPADSSLQRALPQGHYLIARIVKNQLKIDLLSVQPFDVAVLNNSADLNIAVHSTAGKPLANAVVSIDGQRIPFDRRTQTYRLRKSNQRGFLRVEHGGLAVFYDLSRQRNNPWTKRLVNNTPLRYVYRPVEFVLRAPVDLLMSLSPRHGHRTYRMRRLFHNVGRGITCIFNPSECERDQWQGYMVFNKPKFMPGDTVRLKAFVTNRKGRPLKDSVSVMMYPEWDRPVNLGRIAPYLPGSYDFEFALHDSLKLQLDRKIRVELQKKPRFGYMESVFRYEDYELKSLQFSLRADGDYQYRGKPYRLHLKGTDENELTLPDARTELLLTTVQVLEFKDSVVFVPDTLWRKDLALEPGGETAVEIPDSIFPLCDVRYRLEAVLLSADNERVSKSQNVTFFHTHKELHLDLQKDSLRMEYREEGRQKPALATLTLLDALGQALEERLVQLPHTEAVNAYVSEYKLDMGLLKKTWRPASEQALLQCFASRSHDSLFIACDNPRRIPFRYFLYRHNREIERGYSTDWQLHRPAGERETYFIALQYLWGGQVRSENYSVDFARRQLNVQVEQPALAWPGMETDITVTVTDQRGRPVPNADLTAWAVTQKFQPQAPALPWFEKQTPQRRLINTFNALRDQPQNNRTPLNFAYWRSKTGLDTAEYYRFAYPGQKLYRFEYDAPDSIAQFAPFFVLKGTPQPVHVVYVDQKPAYFGWNTTRQPYSIRISPGYHRVELRCTDRLIRIDSLLIAPGKKLILSLSDSIQHPHISTTLMPASLTKDEKMNLYRYIFPFRDRDNHWDYIEQKGEIQLLQPVSGAYGRQLAGPILPNHVQYQNLQGPYTIHFDHEPMMEYDFAPGLLKMRSVNPESDYPDQLRGAAREELNDSIVKKKDIEYEFRRVKWVAHKKMEPEISVTLPGRGRLQLDGDFVYEYADFAYILLFQYSYPGFVRVHPIQYELFHNLRTDTFKAIWLLEDGRYFVTDSIVIQPDGVQYIRMDAPVIRAADDFSRNCRENILEGYFIRQNLLKIRNQYINPVKYEGPGSWFNGRITDEKGEPLIGATISIKGMSIGTITDFDGDYSIFAPDDAVLIVSYAGFEATEVRPSSQSPNNFTLHGSGNMLSEVVVINYKIPLIEQDNLTASVIKKVPTRNLNAISGTVAGIQVSGSRSDATEYYIDGVRVSGERINSLNSNQIKSMEVLRDSAALAVFGPGAAEVVLITTKAGGKGMAYDAAFLEGAAEASSIRSRFSDYAFWQPRLRTNAEGKATFRVNFPDDITQWRTFVPAMTSRRQSGVGEARTRSFKPVAARLSLPRFLVAGDSAMAVGRALNYASDTIDIEAAFEINGVAAGRSNHRLADAAIDSVWLSPANTDSLTVQYSIRKSDGYFDGERRSIPVFPKGIERSEGQFFVLEGDTSVVIQLPEKQGPVQLYARADLLDVLREDLSWLLRYEYDCNEQMASKLKALLADEQIAAWTEQPFRHKQELQKLIHRIEKNRNERGLWGWWNKSATSGWISVHILETLAQARSKGYKVEALPRKAVEEIIWELENRQTGNERKLELLAMLSAFGEKIDYSAYLPFIQKDTLLNVYNRFRIIELQQRHGLPWQRDILLRYQRETMFGNVFFSDNDPLWLPWRGHLPLTLMAARILHRDSTASPDLQRRIRNYLLEQRQSGLWWNTFQRAQWLEFFMETWSKNAKTLQAPRLELSGTVQDSATQFPYERVLPPGGRIELRKTGDFPVYFTAYQRYWDNDTRADSTYFKVRSFFDALPGDTLQAGVPAKLVTEVTVFRDAPYLMVELPIPAGCSYESKRTNYGKESHREYFKHKTAIFCERLGIGTHRFEVELIPRYVGSYQLNPAKVELMYFPVFQANVAGIRVRVR